jgi:hypothetical protein
MRRLLNKAGLMLWFDIPGPKLTAEQTEKSNGPGFCPGRCAPSAGQAGT